MKPTDRFCPIKFVPFRGVRTTTVTQPLKSNPNAISFLSKVRRFSQDKLRTAASSSSVTGLKIVPLSSSDWETDKRLRWNNYLINRYHSIFKNCLFDRRWIARTPLEVRLVTKLSRICWTRTRPQPAASGAYGHISTIFLLLSSNHRTVVYMYDTTHASTVFLITIQSPPP